MRPSTRALISFAACVPACFAAGAHAARLIRARVEDRTDPRPFVYRHLGSLATIGRKVAVVDFGWLRLRGAVAWWFWGAVHIGFLIDLRSRLSVMFHWVWAYLTYRSGARLIIGSHSGAMPILADGPTSARASLPANVNKRVPA